MEPKTVSDTATIMSPVIQYGFAGFAVILLGVVVWMISRLMTILKETTAAINHNTEVISSLLKATTDHGELLRSCHEKLLARPCINKHEGHG